MKAVPVSGGAKPVMTSQEHYIHTLQALHKDFCEGKVSDKSEYRAKREALLLKLDNAHITQLIEETENLNLKQYYAGFLQ